MSTLVLITRSIAGDLRVPRPQLGGVLFGSWPVSRKATWRKGICLSFHHEPGVDSAEVARMAQVSSGYIAPWQERDLPSSGVRRRTTRFALALLGVRGYFVTLRETAQEQLRISVE